MFHKEAKSILLGQHFHSCCPLLSDNFIGQLIGLKCHSNSSVIAFDNHLTIFQKTQKRTVVINDNQDSFR
jgi:hypothetical protein